jgi:murein DD-endopeptidase MepM/ murein hydrolase activator NlpD
MHMPIGPLALLTAVLLGAFPLGSAAPTYADELAPSQGAWPLDPRPEVVESFAPPATRWGPGHRGADLAGRYGQAVLAAAPGRISFAGRLAGRGVVVVSHGDTRTTYEPVTATASVGQLVGPGTVIGRLQLFGSHCYPRACLHWGLIEGHDHYLDPLTLVGAGPVRLLPLHGVLSAALAPLPLAASASVSTGLPARGAAAWVRGPSAMP